MIAAGPSEPLPPISKLSPEHGSERFDCGKADLDRFLKRYALINQRAHAAETYVACRAHRVIGYYSLSVGAVHWSDAPERVQRGLARHPVPVMLLARLAVDRSEQGRGIGTGLLKDAILRTDQAADIAGIRALLVHAKDEDARRWYERFGFEPSPTDPLHLFLLMKDLKRLIG